MCVKHEPVVLVLFSECSVIIVCFQGHLGSFPVFSTSATRYVSRNIFPENSPAHSNHGYFIVDDTLIARRVSIHQNMVSFKLQSKTKVVGKVVQLNSSPF